MPMTDVEHASANASSALADARANAARIEELESIVRDFLAALATADDIHDLRAKVLQGSGVARRDARLARKREEEARREEMRNVWGMPLRADQRIRATNS